jgi:hypothetical protein
MTTDAPFETQWRKTGQNGTPFAAVITTVRRCVRESKLCAHALSLSHVRVPYFCNSPEKTATPRVTPPRAPAVTQIFTEADESVVDPAIDTVTEESTTNASLPTAAASRTRTHQKVWRLIVCEIQPLTSLLSAVCSILGQACQCQEKNGIYSRSLARFNAPNHVRSTPATCQRELTATTSATRRRGTDYGASLSASGQGKAYRAHEQRGAPGGATKAIRIPTPKFSAG